MVAPQIVLEEKKDYSDTNMEKQVEVETADRGRDVHVCSRRGLLSLCCYAGAVTAALIVVVALGAVYQQQTRELCHLKQDAAAAQCGPRDEADPGDEDGESRHLRVKNGDKSSEEDDVIKSKNGRYETILSRSSNTSHPVVIVIDHQRGLTGVYHPLTQECYLMGGMARDAAGVQPDANGQLQFDDDAAPTYEVLYDAEVEDKSLLPPQLQDVCRDKPTFWMQRQPSDEHQRSKRSTGCWYYRVCYTGTRNNVFYRNCFYVRCCGPSEARCAAAVRAKYGG